VLDEPGSNLDADGDLRIGGLLVQLKERGTTVVVHIPSTEHAQCGSI